jgi:hypothetical protein
VPFAKSLFDRNSVVANDPRFVTLKSGIQIRAERSRNAPSTAIIRARVTPFTGGTVSLQAHLAPGRPTVRVAPLSGDWNVPTFPMIRHSCDTGTMSGGHRTSVIG